MTAPNRAVAQALITAELGRLPEADRERVADQILGALESVFMFLPHTVVEREQETRAELDALAPELFRRGGASS